MTIPLIGEVGLFKLTGGVETIDLHGNLVEQLPRGFRRLENLTNLNLTRNKLRRLDVILEIPNLRELRLGENMIEALPESISQLPKLEVLELQRNNVAELPDGLKRLTCLRVLNIAHNQIQDLRLDLLGELNLVQLLASKNKLNKALVHNGNLSMPRLQILDISCNDLTSLTASPSDIVDIPSLQTLNISFNRISALPNISTWTSLSNLLAEDNGLKDLPPGFTNLTSLKSVDVTGNDIKFLDPLISQMDNLEVLNVTANPLRDRKFLTMETEDVKKHLAARLETADFVPL